MSLSSNHCVHVHVHVHVAFLSPPLSPQLSPKLTQFVSIQCMITISCDTSHSDHCGLAGLWTCGVAEALLLLQGGLVHSARLDMTNWYQRGTLRLLQGRSASINVTMNMNLKIFDECTIKSGDFNTSNVPRIDKFGITRRDSYSPPPPSCPSSLPCN